MTFGGFLRRAASGAGRLLGHAGSALKTVGDFAGSAAKGFAESGAVPLQKTGIGILGNVLAPETGGASALAAGAINKGIDFIANRGQGLASKISQVGNIASGVGAALNKASTAGKPPAAAAG
jgi:hypothetical protein